MNDTIQKNGRSKWILLAVIVLFVGLIVGWCLWSIWHRSKTITLEIHKMGSIPALPSQVVVGNSVVSLHGIYEAGGVNLTVKTAADPMVDQDLVTMADVHRILSDLERGVQAEVALSKVFAIEVKDLKGNEETSTKRALLGVTLDFGEHNGGTIARSGFAVFTHRHSRDPADLFLTGAHELTHIFNIHHNDWEPGPGRSYKYHTTIEGMSSPDTVLWRLSDSSIRHLKEHRSEEVWPSRRALSFGTITSTHCGGHQKGHPTEQYEVVDAATLAAVPGDCPSDSAQTIQSASLGGQESDTSGSSGDLSLQLELPKNIFMIGDPVVVTIGLHNVGPRTEEVNPLLNPMFGFLVIEIKPPNESSFRPFLQPVVGDIRNGHLAQLAPGESLHEEAKIFFNAKGWTFTAPGRYLVRAEFPIDMEGDHIIASEPLEVNLVLPKSPADKRAAELIMGDEQGLILTLNGGDHLTQGMNNLKQVITEVPSSAQAPAVRLALGMDALNPPIGIVPGNEGVRLRAADEYLRPLFSARLPPVSVVTAEIELAKEFSNQGFGDRAHEIWKLLHKYFGRDESVANLLDNDRSDNSPEEELGLGPIAVSPHWSRYKYPSTIPDGARYYLVRKGDTLSRIAKRFLGRRGRWTQILKWNPYIANPHLIFPGDPVIIQIEPLNGKGERSR